MSTYAPTVFLAKRWTKLLLAVNLQTTVYLYLIKKTASWQLTDTHRHTAELTHCNARRSNFAGQRLQFLQLWRQRSAQNDKLFSSICQLTISATDELWTSLWKYAAAKINVFLINIRCFACCTESKMTMELCCIVHSINVVRRTQYTGVLHYYSQSATICKLL